MGISTQELAIAFYAATGAAKGLLILGAIGATIFTLSVAMAALSNPITWLIGGVAALGAAWNTNFYGMRTTTLQFVAIVSHAFAQLPRELPDDIREIGDNFANGVEAWKGILSRLPGVMSTVMNNTSKAFSGFISLWPGWMVDVMKSIYDTVVGYMSSALSYFGSAIGSLSDMLPSMPAMEYNAPAFPDLSQSFQDGMGMFALPPTLGLQIATPEVYKFAEATAMATQRAQDAKKEYGEMNINLDDVSSGAKSAGKSVAKMAEDVAKAKEKISDQSLSMANLRGEIAQLESQFPGLTNEVINNFNAHTAAGNSVASFGDKLGATERRQMFNYLVKLIDINDQNKQLMASNGLVDKSMSDVGDSFMTMVNTMSTGLKTPLEQFPVVGQLSTDLATTTQNMAGTSTAMGTAATAATTLNPLLTTMSATYTDSLNPALLSASTYMPIISQAWADMTTAITLLTNEPLPLLITAIKDTLNPELQKLSLQVDTLANTQLNNLNNVISALLLPSLGQLFTSLNTQVLTALQMVTSQSNLLIDAYNIMVAVGQKVADISKKIYDAMVKEAAQVKKLTSYYYELAKAKREANAAGSTTPQPVEPGAGFASGGSFVVPSGYPASGAGMPIRVHSGELVKIFTAAQTRQMNRSQANQRIVSNSTNTTNNSNKSVTFNITTQQPSKSILSDLAFAKAKYGVF
jgi:hypothetical protein